MVDHTLASASEYNQGAQVTLNREKHTDEMTEWLLQLQRRIEAHRSLRHLNSAIELENFFRDVLNQIFGLKLENANALFGQNQDSFDLSDEGNRVAVQVTVTLTPAKIRSTLKSFVGKHDKKFDRLIFVYPTFEIPVSKANFASDLKGFDFDSKRDRCHLGTILQKAQHMTVPEQTEFLNLLRMELAPLGTSVRLGVDQTMETLIAVIQYMSENSPIDRIAFDEKQPDVQEKLERFKSHASYLISQFKSNQGLHATIEQARSAIGYDSVRAAKIQAWLKSRSIEVLHACANNAQLAFQTLTAELLNRAHTKGTDAEETAVRFLLADEFIRCNVFPNP